MAKFCRLSDCGPKFRLDLLSSPILFLLSLVLLFLVVLLLLVRLLELKFLRLLLLVLLSRSMTIVTMKPRADGQLGDDPEARLRAVMRALGGEERITRDSVPSGTNPKP